MPNTWETTTQSEFKKPLMIQSQRPYLNKISKQNDQTLTSLELGQEAATTRMPMMESSPSSSTTTSQPPPPPMETTQAGSVVNRQNTLPILIDPMKQTTESESMQIVESISMDYNENIPLNTLNISSSKSEYPKTPSNSLSYVFYFGLFLLKLLHLMFIKNSKRLTLVNEEYYLNKEGI
ncbi:unnamed protein product [Trichobilharzia regenti]|nr:unnamed protein product [Trichobilharzia regenti]